METGFALLEPARSSSRSYMPGGCGSTLTFSAANQTLRVRCRLPLVVTTLVLGGRGLAVDALPFELVGERVLQPLSGRVAITCYAGGMLWEFERLFWHPDKIEIAAREQRDENEGVDEDAAAPPPPVQQTCRVCGHTGITAYCPTCLADTMTGAPARR